MTPAHRPPALHPGFSRMWLLAIGLGLGANAVAGVVAVTSAIEPAELFRWRPFLGPFHSLVLHYPIGFLTLAVILEVYRRFRSAVDLRPVIRLVIWLSLFTGILSAVLGLMRASGGGYEGQAVEIHRWFGLGVPLMTVVTLFFQNRALGQAARPVAQRAYEVALGLTLTLLVVAGHYGGNLTHGSRYLTQYAPSFVRSWLDEAPAAPGSGNGNDASRQQYFQVIQPLLESKCTPCHGSEKQKGKYRLDQRALALAAGKSGHIGIQPGDAFASEVVKRVLLPPGNDDLMPPDGKDPLSATEILALVRWIQSGTSYGGEGESTVLAEPIPDNRGASNRIQP